MEERCNTNDQASTESDELEPIILGEVTKVTGTGGATGDDGVVWGSF